jgi:hypothetical protein
VTTPPKTDTAFAKELEIFRVEGSRLEDHCA